MSSIIATIVMPKPVAIRLTERFRAAIRDNTTTINATTTLGGAGKGGSSMEITASNETLPITSVRNRFSIAQARTPRYLSSKAP